MKTTLTAVATAAALSMAAPTATTYQATWASVDKHTPAPEWYQDAKFGIFFHWGVYSVPAYANEWYPKYMYDKTNSSYTHHMNTYGDPFGDWGYENFILGKKDKSGNFVQFAPKLKSAGGNFDPDEFATLIAASGARFAGPVTEHHDGFSMWDSKVNEWNAAQKGPKLDLYKLFADAFRKKNLKVLAAFHHAYHFNGFYSQVPAKTDTSLKKLFGQLGSARENQLWLDKIKEVVDAYQPDFIWHDFSLYAVDAQKQIESLQYYYNSAIDWKKDVLVTYKDGPMDKNGEVFDYERRFPTKLTTPYWQCHFGISASTWAWKSGMSYYSITGLIHMFIDIVSKGGNLLLNFGPMPDGSIPQEAKDRLNAYGDWLGKFGESIYATRPWVVYGEGPTTMGTDGTGYINVSNSVGTKSDIRYTMSKDKRNLYAIFLGWPGNGTPVTLASVTTARLALTSSSKVYLFGTTATNSTELRYVQDGSGLKVTMPASQPYTAYAYALKISLDGVPPAPPAPITTGLADRGSRDVDSPVHGTAGIILCGRNLPTTLHVPKNMTGIVIYSRDGKVASRMTVVKDQTSIRLPEALSSSPANAYYVEYSP